MSVQLSFENLAVLDGGDRLPLSALDLDVNSHIHGGLRFQISGRLVPHMGYWGPDDVCFNTWLEEFENLVKAFDLIEEATYILDEDRQGQPAYQFEKNGAVVSLSIVDARYSGGGGADPEWQQVGFEYEEFKREYLKFKKTFIEEVKRAAPEVAEKWIEQLL